MHFLKSSRAGSVSVVDVVVVVDVASRIDVERVIGVRRLRHFFISIPYNKLVLTSLLPIFFNIFFNITKYKYLL